MERKNDSNESNKDKHGTDKNTGKPQAGQVDTSTKPNAMGGKPGDKTSTEVQTDRLVNEGGPSKPSDSQPKSSAKSPAGSNAQNSGESNESAKPVGRDNRENRDHRENRDNRDNKDGNTPSMKKPKSNTAES